MEMSDYLAALPEQRRQRLMELISTIQQLYPAAQQSMVYKMPTFHWQQGWVAVANQKGYLSLYTCSPVHLQQFQQKHPYIKCGKGCINFKDKDPLPLEDLHQVIHSAMQSAC